MNIKRTIEFENNCWVGLVDSSDFNNSELHRIKAVTDIASIVTGKLEQNYKEEYFRDIICEKRKNLYNKLLKESNGKPSTPFEFVPIIAHTTRNLNSDSEWLKHATLLNNIVYTNLRNEIKHDECSDFFSNEYDAKDYKAFKIIVGRVPMKTISHLRTHRAFSWLVESSRNKKYLNNVEFWYPSRWNESYKRIKKETDRTSIISLKDDISNGLIKPEEATMELSDRRLVHFAMAAWIHDTNAWNNLFKVRGNKTGTMGITETTVTNIKTLIQNDGIIK